MNDLQQLLIAAAARYPLRQDFADALGISREHLGRLLSTKAPPTATLSVENCLRVADLTGKSASLVLRRANKAAIADMLDRLYGPNRYDEALLATASALATIPESARRPIEALIWQLAEGSPAQGHESMSARPGEGAETPAKKPHRRRSG